MKALIDTNVLLDYLLARIPYSESVITLFQLANVGFVELLVTDLSIANIAYITRREISKDDFYRVMQQLEKFYQVIPVGPNVISKAFAEQWNDFEDALQNYSAIQAQAECIITRNTKDFTASQLTILTPEDFISKLSQ